MVTVPNRKVTAMRLGDSNSDLALKNFGKENRAVGLTNGLFSLISLIRSTLKITGPANILVSTWSAGFYDAEEINSLLSSGKIISFKLILDRSFKTRQSAYSVHITKLFSESNIRTTDNHAKFVLIYNDEWTVCIRSSMNLNENKRCENFDIDNDFEIFSMFKTFADELFEKQQPGIIEGRKIVDPVFADLFNQPSHEGFFIKTSDRIGFRE